MMMHFARSRIVLAALALFGTAASTQAVMVTISNLCSTTVSLYDNSATVALAPGASTSRTLAAGYLGMFRDGAGEQATCTYSIYPINLESLSLIQVSCSL